MELISVNAKGQNKGHYSPAVKAGGMLYISGQLSIDPDTRIVPAGGIEEHMALALRNMERVLQAASLTKDDVVQCRIYTSDMKYWDKINEIYGNFFGDHYPARCVVPVPELHFGCLVEIEAIAECH